MVRTIHPAEPALMEPLTRVFEAGSAFFAMVANAVKNAELYRITRSRAIVPASFVERVGALGRRWYLLSISEDWCGDSVNILPWVDALASASPLLDHRIIRRDEHLDLMDAHLTNGATRSIPIVLLLDEEFRERGWWGPRPRALQEWFESAEAQAMEKPDRYKVLRTRYAQDRGRSIMDEIVSLMELAVAQGAEGASAMSQAAPQA